MGQTLADAEETKASAEVLARTNSVHVKAYAIVLNLHFDVGSDPAGRNLDILGLGVFGDIDQQLTNGPKKPDA